MSVLAKLIGVALAVAAAATAASAATTLVTSEAGYSGPGLDLGGYDNGQYNFTLGTISLPGGLTLTLAPDNDQGSVVGQGSYGLNDNGSLGGSATYIGLDSGSGYAEITFATAVSSFGGFFNYAPESGDSPVISAFDAMGDLLGSYDLSVLAPISTPGGFNEFAFRGIASDQADIKSFRFGGSYIVLAGTAGSGPGTPSPVPVPAAMPMLLAGLAGLGGLAASRRRA